MKYSKDLAFNALIASQQQYIALIQSTADKAFYKRHPKKQNNKVYNIKRKRKTIRQVYNEMGRTYFRRAYRMDYEVFLKLFKIILPNLKKIKNPTRKQCPNGPIPLSARLGAAIRFWAGGQAYDIKMIFGMSHSEVFHSVDMCLEAINQCDELGFTFPADHAKQKEIADGFKEKSEAELDWCVGVIDGMLIWTYCPDEAECKKVGVGQKKFLCYRKGKFGLNFQAICDHELRFLDVCIRYGGATSDLLAFEASNIKASLEKEGFLMDGLCVFGDNAYVNTRYMATPYPGVRGANDKDSYNFFFSQLRIKIECAFGVLVNRWGFLRTRAPQKYTVEKTMATVSCLCRLHNFFINERLSKKDVPDSVPTATDKDVPEPTATDTLNMTLNGAVEMCQRDGTGDQQVPDALMDAGHHSDDDPNQDLRRRIEKSGISTSEALPREQMCKKIMDVCLRRPLRNIRENQRA